MDYRACNDTVCHHFHNLKLCVMLQITKELVDSVTLGKAQYFVK